MWGSNVDKGYFRIGFRRPADSHQYLTKISLELNVPGVFPFH